MPKPTSFHSSSCLKQWMNLIHLNNMQRHTYYKVIMTVSFLYPFWLPCVLMTVRDYGCMTLVYRYTQTTSFNKLKTSGGLNILKISRSILILMPNIGMCKKLIQLIQAAFFVIELKSNRLILSDEHFMHLSSYDFGFISCCPRIFVMAYISIKFTHPYKKVKALCADKKVICKYW